jgi:hypothetical protein
VIVSIPIIVILNGIVLEIPAMLRHHKQSRLTCHFRYPLDFTPEEADSMIRAMDILQLRSIVSVTDVNICHIDNH